MIGRNSTGFIVIAMAALAATSGCYGSTIPYGTADGDSDAPPDPSGDETAAGCTNLWDCNPGVECGQMVPCIEGLCREDVEPVHIECPPPGYCLSDLDCIIADPYDCCNGCPVTVHRDTLEELPCHYERGTARPDPIPIECAMDCFWCPPCFPQPLWARCDEGVCVAGDEGCPYSGEWDPPSVTPARVAADPYAYAGGVYTLRGSTIARWPTCDDFCSGEAPCCNSALYLDGVVRLEGWPCDADLGCTSVTSCPYEWECAGIDEGQWLEVIGEIRAFAGWEPPAIVVEGLRTLEPESAGGLYGITVTSVDVWADEPWISCEEVLRVGDAGEMIVADAEGSVVVSASIFGPFASCMEFWGNISGSWMDVRVPIDCDGCCCDYWIEGTIGGGSVSATFFSYDGVCHTQATFTGNRVP